MELVKKDAETHTPGSGWERTKQGYCGLLSGYQSPNGSTVNVAVDLAALIIMSAVSETTVRNSLSLQEAANDRLLRQAEEHRALAHKQFTEGMARMQAEHEKTIADAARIRDEYAQSAKMAQFSYASMVSKVESSHGSNVVGMQMDCLLKRSKQYELDLQEITEKHMEELQDRDKLCIRYKRDLEKALSKNKALEKEKRDLEEHLLKGVLPSSSSSAPNQGSVDSSPEQREHKRPKIDAPSKTDRGHQPEKGPSEVSATKAHTVSRTMFSGTTAYTQSTRDALNMKIVSKDPSSIATPARVRGPMADLSPKAREAYTQAYRHAILSAGPELRSDTAKRVKAANDAGEAAVIQDNLLQVKADKAEVDDKYQAKATKTYQAKAADKNQAKANNKQGRRKDSPAVELVTMEQRMEALKIWKDLLVSTNHYQPFVPRSPEEELKEVKVLRSAMNHFRLLGLTGMKKLRNTHDEFKYLQERYYIPRDFIMPADFFREEQLDFNVAYDKRCCSLHDFYNMLSKDSPGFVSKEIRRAEKERPQSSEAVKSSRHESPVTQDSATRRLNPSFNPFVHAHTQPQRQEDQPQRQEAQPQRHNVVPLKSTNPSNLDREQRESAEEAEARRRAPRRNAPIPSDGDETNTDGETSHLFKDKLSTAEKSRILKLKTEIKRLKSRIYTPAYLKERERAITSAESSRSVGGLGPEYLEGVAYPWYSDRGQAPIHYDVHQVDLLQSTIDKILENNASMCQLEYTANKKHGPSGQARS